MQPSTTANLKLDLTHGIPPDRCGEGMLRKHFFTYEKRILER